MHLTTALHFKGTLSRALLQKFKISKKHFTAKETYKYWSSFDKNYNAIEWSWKKYHQELKFQTWKNQPEFFKFCHRDSVPLMFI